TIAGVSSPWMRAVDPRKVHVPAGWSGRSGERFPLPSGTGGARGQPATVRGSGWTLQPATWGYTLPVATSTPPGSGHGPKAIAPQLPGSQSVWNSGVVVRKQARDAPPDGVNDTRARPLSPRQSMGRMLAAGVHGCARSTGYAAVPMS